MSEGVTIRTLREDEAAPFLELRKATDAQIDFSDRGGMVMSRRFEFPSPTCSR